MLSFTRDFQRAAQLTVRLVNTMPIFMGVVFLFSFAGNQYFEWLAQLLNDSDQGPILAQLGQFCFSIIESCILLLVGCYFLVNLNQTMSWKEFFKRFTSPLTAETFRALTRVLLWALCLAAPAVPLYCRLYFVPFVIVLDPTYESHPDAVKRCLDLTRSCWFSLILINFALGIFEVIFEVGPSLLHIDNLLYRFPWEFANFIFSLFGFFILYVIFENLRQAQPAPR